MGNEHKKIDRIKPALYEGLNILSCPLCGGVFSIRDNSLVCGVGHSFDISKKGYVNLFCKSTKITETYGKELFTARKSVSDAGIYDELCRTINGYINMRFKSPIILDAGAGCGNITKKIFDGISDSRIFGLDLSKHGINVAATEFFTERLIWVVGNINQLPFRDKCFDVVLNVMSPANYAEFKRVKKSGGIILKVLVGANYLAEVRRFIYGDDDRNEYTNSGVMDNLAENAEIDEKIDVLYTHTLQGQNVLDLFDMTPLTVKIGGDNRPREEIRRQFAEENTQITVTLDFKVVVCR